MQPVPTVKSQTKRAYPKAVWFILLPYLGLHLFLIGTPRTPSIYDETGLGGGYVFAAREMLDGRGGNEGYPPLVRVLTCPGLLLAGSVPTTWRLPIILISVGVLFLVFDLTYRLLGYTPALLATGLLASDGCFFFFSHGLLIDVPPIFFLLLGIRLLVAHRFRLAGAGLGSALLCKFSVVPSVALVLVSFAVWLYRKRREMGQRTTWWLPAFETGVFLVVTFIGGLSCYLSVWKSEQHLTMPKYLADMRAAQHATVMEPPQTRNVLGLLVKHAEYRRIEEPLDAAVMPVSFVYSTRGNIPLWWAMLVLPLLTLARVLLSGRLRLSLFDPLVFCSLAIAVVIAFMYWIRLVFDRFIIEYYALPAVPFAAVLLAVTIVKARRWRALAWGYGACCVLWFFLHFPIRYVAQGTGG